jgi:P-type Ca2+ transporter type 2C
MTTDDLMSSAAAGLREDEAQRRLQRDGPNDIEPARRRSLARRALALLTEPMFALLLAAVLIYLALGDLGEGLTLAVFVLAVLALTLVQEGRADRSIEALRRLSEHRVELMRDGVVVERAAREVVQGDVLLLAEGRRVAADGVLLQADNLQLDESLLTGESLPVSKHLGGEPASDRLFAGTHVVRGQGLMRVQATGGRTEFGQIGRSLQTIEPQPTPLQRQTAKLVRVLAVLALLLCAVMVLIEGLRTGQWLPALLVGIAAAMAMLPEEYPVVLAIFPALGARRLARHGVLTRRMQAIETLGATTVLCADKTGTITQNRMAVQALAVGDGASAQLLRCPPGGLWPAHDHSAAFHRLAEHAILASAPQAFDPMEQAFHQLGRTLLQGTDRLHDWDLVQTYPLSPQLRAMSHVWRIGDGRTM